jgi:hypothetical protein
MHPSLARLLRCAHDATATASKPIQTLAQLQVRLDVSPQTMNNWKNRGVSKAGAIKAAKEFGCAVTAILDEQPGWMEPHHPKEGARPGGALAQEMIQRPYIVAPTVQWERILKKTDLPAEFYVVLVDDAMAPKAPAGTKVKFKRDGKPAPGDAVLVADQEGELYFRVYHAGLHGAWEAHATNDVYPTLQAQAHSLRVVAIFCGVDAAWSQLSR